MTNMGDEIEQRRVRLPLQPTFIQGPGRLRFVSNRIVEDLLAASDLGLDQIVKGEYTAAEREQFASLIGYSLQGFRKLTYVREETYNVAELQGEGFADTEAAARELHLRTALGECKRCLKDLATDVLGRRVEGDGE